MKDLANAIERSLKAEATPERAEKEKAYLKSELEHLGASVPAIRRVTRAALAELSHEGLIELARALWAKPVHERRMAAVEVLEARSKQLVPGDLELIERFLREARGWALVDGLAANVAGPLVERFPELERELDRWAKDEDFWIRRSALLARLLALRAGRGDFEAFARHADAMLEETEFFVRKAIGWVLRAASKKRPNAVADWLEPRAARASGVTIREAVKYLPEERRRRLLSAHAAGRVPRQRRGMT
ncbi:MAG TPA: DNA alkylation repair protein [Myxococcales bacterium]|jgi:3-methyladenine DNA glycosylase AlkD|nr:DNA alkylation repair protein [Myxococcales bacterium]